MSISTEHLRAAGELVGAAATLRDAASIWRSRHPEMKVVLVNAMDMRDEKPALMLGARKVYLATSNGHCWSVTEQPEEADALILTQD